MLTLDPDTGPFSDLEFEAIGLNAAHRYAEGKLRTDRYACLSIFKASGRQADQIGSIKCKDFFIRQSIRIHHPEMMYCSNNWVSLIVI